ncbi:hypothetical protein [Haloechinothrix salitolerans]
MARLRRFAFARPSLLLLSAPTATVVRLAVERFVRGEGWSLASGAADADALVTAGPLPPDLAAIADTLEAQLAPPCERISVTEPDETSERLSELPERLARGGARVPDRPLPEEPPMAGMVEDRDGLMLDALHVPLGPALPFWPPGLRLHVQLRGDVIGHAHAETLGVDGVTGSFWDTAPAGVRALDACVRLFGVAGWHAAHTRCLVLRDRLLARAGGDHQGERGGRRADGGDVRAEVRRLARKARFLDPELRGLAPVPGVGDAADRLRTWLAVAAGGESEAAPGSVETPSPISPARRTLTSAQALDLLPELVTGMELGTARLAVASLDIDVTEAGIGAVAATVGDTHG